MLRGLSLILGPDLLDDLISIVSTYLRFEGIEVDILKAHTGGVTCLAVAPEWSITGGVGDAMNSGASRLASGSVDRTIRIWDLSTGRSQVLEGHAGGVNALAVLPVETWRGKDCLNSVDVAGRIASGSNDNTIRIWNLSTGTSQVLEGHTDWVYSLAVIPDTTGIDIAHPTAGRLASGSLDNTIRIWDLSTETSQVLEGHTSWVVTLAAFPDGRLASGSWDKTIRIWDLSTGTSRALEGHTSPVTSLAVVPNETVKGKAHLDSVDVADRLASGSDDRTIRIWDLSTGRSQVLEGHTRSVTSLVVFLDGRLVSGSDDNTIRVWDLSTGTSQVLEGHTGYVNTLAVLPDGRLASGSQDKTIRVWV